MRLKSSTAPFRNRKSRPSSMPVVRASASQHPHLRQQLQRQQQLPLRRQAHQRPQRLLLPLRQQQPRPRRLRLRLQHQLQRLLLRQHLHHPTPTPTPSYVAQIQQPINADGTSIFSVRRGVVPVKFTLTQDGVATCALPPATIAVTRTSGGNRRDRRVHLHLPADSGSNFRIDSCQYIYNLSASALGVGTYRVDIRINGQVVGSATFQLK